MSPQGMMMGGGMGGMMGGSGALSPSGVDFSNRTQAVDFLAAILDDDELKIVGNAYARYFWYGIAVAVVLATVANLVQVLTLRMRVRAAAQKKDKPSRPRHLVMQCLATMTAMARESTYLQLTPRWRFMWLRIPPMGTITLVLAHFAFVLTLEFVHNDVPGAQFWQARGVRAGWLSVAQLPLLIILVGKYNIISILSGVSYERINVLHRWTARIMLFMAILHFGYQSYGWQKFGLMKLEWDTDTCPPTGIAAFALLLWMNLSTLAPIRSWSYEFFVIQHLITFFGFIVAVMYHLPTTALQSRIHVYIPIVLWFVDRSIQAAVSIYFSMNTSAATVIALEGDATKVKVSNKAIKKWSPGSFVLLSIPQFGWIQSHPATIVSTPQSHEGDLVFILKCHKGFTKRLMLGANSSSTALLPHTKQESQLQQNMQLPVYRAFIHGPYGGSHGDFGSFDSICLLAGSTGITFTLALLQNIADRVSSGQKLPLRRVHFMWCVKSSSWTRWCNEEISSAYDKIHGAGLDIDISVYVTCADAFTEDGDEPKECGCACDKSLGSCCCVVVDEDEEEVKDENTTDRTTRTPAEKSGAVTVTMAESDKAVTRLKVLRCASFYSGRPDIQSVVTQLLDGADGESAISVCGPIAMSSSVRNTVVRLSDERAIHKGSGAQGCYLHVESFS